MIRTGNKSQSEIVELFNVDRSTVSRMTRKVRLEEQRKSGLLKGDGLHERCYAGKNNVQARQASDGKHGFVGRALALFNRVVVREGERPRVKTSNVL